MENYREQLHKLLKEIVGSDDVLNTDYKSVDRDTSYSELDFAKVRGSVRLYIKKVLTPEEADKQIESFLSTKLP